MIMPRYTPYFRNYGFVLSSLFSILLLFGSLVVNFYAGTYATEKASNSVTDIILSNIRIFDVEAVFIYGPLLLWTFVGILFIFKPQRIPFALKSISLFILIRSVFISLTHIGPFPSAIPIDSVDVINSIGHVIGKFTFGGDLFFSAHTGLPFLMSLLFWEQRVLRLIFIAISLLFGVVVLAGHLHYSIDVLSAFFITYTIHHLAVLFFPRDHDIFERGIALSKN